MSADADPVFETREALEAWVEAERVVLRLRWAVNHEHCKTEARIRRVTAAHQHLKETPRHD